MEGSQPMYACPMHPEETSDQPGSCPVCGMAMVMREEPAPAEQPTEE